MSCYYCGGGIGCEWCKKKIAPEQEVDTTLTTKKALKPFKVASSSASDPSAQGRKKLYGFVSAEHDRFGFGTFIYRHIDGSLVEVAWVHEDPDAPDYHWVDKKNIGEVTELISEGRPNQVGTKKTIGRSLNINNPSPNG